MITTTQTQLNACTRFVDSHGKPYYEVISAHEEDVTYTVRWNGHFAQDNCRAGRRGADCWHCRAAVLSENIFKGIVHQDVVVEKYETEQLALDGFKCYERKAFSLLR